MMPIVYARPTISPKQQKRPPRIIFISIFLVLLGITTLTLLLAVKHSAKAPQLNSSLSRKPSSKESPSANQSMQEQKIQNQSQKTDKPKPQLGYDLPPKSTMVALYGTPDTRTLGALGEQPLTETLTRIKNLTKEYSQHTSKTIIPVLEIITTVASASPTINNDYSNETDINRLKPLVKAAKENNIYIILDLQPGLSDFLTQTKMYQELLKEPHVGLALDPEWRLKPGQQHMKQIGSVSADEVNQTAQWLSKLTADNGLPDKVFLVHQFKLAMLEDRHKLDTASTSNLRWIIQMDGLGAQPVKLNTWRTIQTSMPLNILLGWKNFIDEDKPMLSPDQTLLIDPTPSYISYQ